jgi:hypothetical protein
MVSSALFDGACKINVFRGSSIVEIANIRAKDPMCYVSFFISRSLVAWNTTSVPSCLLFISYSLK